MRRLLSPACLSVLVVAACTSTDGTTGGETDTDSGDGADSGAATTGTGSSGPSGSGSTGASSSGSGTGGSDTGSSDTEGSDTGDDTDPGNGWVLVWSDEFDGEAIDLSKWEHEVDCWGGGNNEDQCYVADEKNSHVGNGMLSIVAIDDSPSGPIGGPGNDPTVVTRGHSSARLRTRSQGDWTYGRIEARARLPHGQGLWPAIWMLPTDEVYGGWARSGEIDSMEAVNLGVPGENENRVHGTLHYGAEWPGNVYTGDHYDPAESVSEAFHVYALEWEEGEIRWYVNDVHYATQTEWYSEGYEFPAPFDQRFHLILNVAVGGNWPGPPDKSTVFPQTLEVDYVRVYECSVDPVTGHGCATG